MLSSLENEAVKYAQEFGISPAVYLALVNQESGWNPGAVSDTGALGLTQFEPSTLQGLGISVSDFLSSTSLQLKAGAEYLAQLLTQNSGNYQNALAAYNAGQGAVDEYGGIPPYPETQNYVSDIISASQGIAQKLNLELPLSKLGLGSSSSSSPGSSSSGSAGSSGSSSGLVMLFLFLGLSLILVLFLGAFA